MDEIEKIQVQLAALQDALDALLRHEPTDMVAVRLIQDRIRALRRKLQAIIGSGVIPPVSPAKVQALRNAVSTLQAQISRSAATAQIASAAMELADL